MDNMNPKSYLSRTNFLLDRCRDKSVLHLGCSSGSHIRARMERGSLLHMTLASVAKELHGIDLDNDSLNVMRSELGLTNLYHGNVEHLEKVGITRKFGVVVAGDLLEHITCPGLMLEGVKPLLDTNGIFIISTNNAFGLHFQISRWLGRYREHFEHVCFYSPETLVHLFERHGYTIEEMHGAYTEPPYTLTKRLQFAIGAPLFKLFPVLAGTLAVVAKPKKDTI